MKNVTVEYSPLPGLERTGVLAPILPITFINGVYSLSTLALVDSGATKGLISTHIADELHLNWKEKVKREGFSTGGNFIFHELDDIDAEIFNNNYLFSLNVVEAINPFRCILGRSDIFRVAKITFEGYKNQFHMEFRNLN